MGGRSKTYLLLFRQGKFLLHSSADNSQFHLFCKTYCKGQDILRKHFQSKGLSSLCWYLVGWGCGCAYYLCSPQGPTLEHQNTYKCFKKRKCCRERERCINLHLSARRWLRQAGSHPDRKGQLKAEDLNSAQTKAEKSHEILKTQIKNKLSANKLSASNFQSSNRKFSPNCVFIFLPQGNFLTQ